MIDQNTTFSMRNYFRPTPKNLLRVSEAIQGTLMGVQLIALPTGAPWWVSFIITLGVIFTNQIVKFFGSIVHEQQETAVAEFPSGEKVTLTHEVEQKEETNKPNEG